jgi:glutamate synthase (ferredoxin)
MVIELLLMTGRSLPEAMMMVPEAWEKHHVWWQKKHSMNLILYHGAMGWTRFYSFTDGNVIEATGQKWFTPITIYIN